MLVAAVVLGKRVSSSLRCLGSVVCCGGRKFRLVVSRRRGLALARNECFSFAGAEDLVVMVDDDLVFTGELLDWCVRVQRGNFALAKVGEHVSSRVLVIHKSDFDLDYAFQKKTDLWGNIPLPMVKQLRVFRNYQKMVGGQHKRAAAHAVVPFGVSLAVKEGLESQLLIGKP